jgi:MATE family multidrug resistance protein
MSSLAATAAPLRASPLAAEIRATLALAGPLALSQLGQIAINTTDVLILGRLGPEPLAAASLALSPFFLCFVTLLGVVTAVSPLAAQALGAKKPREVRRAVRQGLWVAGLLSLPCLALLWHVEAILLALGQDPGLAAESAVFMHAFVWSLPTAIGFIVLRCFVTAFGSTRAVVAIMLVGVVVNAFLAWGLVFGAFGLPRLGLVGSGIASSLVNAAMFTALLVYSVRVRPFRRYAILGRFWRPDWPTFREILKVGLPIGGGLLMEVGLFAAAVMLMGWIGTDQVAAHQVTIQIASASFMIPLGISMAATIRVGLAIGAGDLVAARRAGRVALGIGSACMAACALLFWTFPATLVGLFLDRADPASARPLELAALFILVAAAFQLVDGIQVIAAGALRGMRDTRVPMLLAAVSYWLVGFPAAYLLAFPLGWGGLGVWIGLALALAAAAVLMLARLERLSARGLPLPAA